MDIVARPEPRVSALFDRHAVLRAVIDSGLERRAGELFVDDAREPRAAFLRLGCYSIPGGDPDVDGVEDMLDAIPAGTELVLPDDLRWRRKAGAVLGGRMEDRPMRTFDPETLDRARLSKLADLLLDGARIEPIDARSVLALTADLEPHGVQAFGSSQRFLDRGLGFAVVMGDRVASQASSYAASRERVEVAIATHPEHRGRGLAAAVAARMLLHCLETGRRPEWSAANPVSKRLARRLGYAPGPLCDAVLVRNAVRG